MKNLSDMIIKQIYPELEFSKEGNEGYFGHPNNVTCWAVSGYWVAAPNYEEAKLLFERLRKLKALW